MAVCWGEPERARHSLVSRGPDPSHDDLWAKRKGREEEGSGDSEQDFVGSAGMLAEPIRLRSNYVCNFDHDFHVECVTRLIVDMARNVKVEQLSKDVSSAAS